MLVPKKAPIQSGFGVNKVVTATAPVRFRRLSVVGVRAMDVPTAGAENSKHCRLHDQLAHAL